jgi:hypothetical protein
LHETIDDDAPVITWSVYVNIHDDVQVQWKIMFLSFVNYIRTIGMLS